MPEIGDHIRAGRMAEASEAAARHFRAVNQDHSGAQQLAVEFTGDAYSGFFKSYFSILGMRDAGRVDPAAAATLDTLLKELQAIYKGKGRGCLSRHSAAFFQRSVIQLLPVLLSDDAPECLDDVGRQIAALVDMLECALAGPAGPDDAWGEPSARGGRKPWWRFW